MKPHILLVEDDHPLRMFLEEMLTEHDYQVTATSKGSEAMNFIESSPPDLVLLDLQLPDLMGEDILKKVKSSYPELPIIILTAKSSPQDTASGLNLGADDYLGKPFSEEELLARIRARLRIQSSPILTHENIILDNSARTLTISGSQIELTKNEFDLLSYLLSNKGKVITRENILNRVWGYASDVESRVIDVYIGYLRNKLGKNGNIIQTVRGVGYTIRSSDN